MTVDMTDITTGALPGRNDDGAVQFNEATGVGSDYLTGTNVWSGQANNPFENRIATGLTVMGWVKPTASATNFDGSILSLLAAGVGDLGYVLGVEWPARTIFYRPMRPG